MYSECVLEQHARESTLSTRFRSHAYELPEHFERIYTSIARYLGELGEEPAGPPFARYHNMNVADLDVEAGFPTGEEAEGRADIQSGELPASMVATCVHTGTYQSLDESYDALLRFIQTHGYVPAGPIYEFYLNDPADVGPQQLQTKLVIPVAKA